MDLVDGVIFLWFLVHVERGCFLCRSICPHSLRCWCILFSLASGVKYSTQAYPFTLKYNLYLAVMCSARMTGRKQCVMYQTLSVKVLRGF